MNIVATVSRINGEVYALRGNEKILLQVGSPLTDDDTVITKDSGLEITFTDKTQVTLSEDTEIMISDYVFTQTDESFLLSITKGTMQSISGEIVKRNPEAFEIQSPKATMGIRGTTTLHTVSDNGDENHVVLSISDGHTVHINTTSGSFALLTSSSEGVVIGSGGTAVTPFVLSTSELNEIIQIMDNMDNPQDVLQQLNVKLKQIQNNEDISSTESQNLQSVTETLDTLTQEGKQLSVITEEAVISSDSAEQVNEENQSQEDAENEPEGLAQEFEESTKTYKEAESSTYSEQSKVLDSSFETPQSQQEQIIPEVLEPSPSIPATPLEPSTPTLPTPPTPSYTEIKVTPTANGVINFQLNDGTQMRLGQFTNTAESFLFFIENLNENGEGSDSNANITGTVNMYDDGFMFAYNGEEFRVVWQEDDDIVLVTSSSDMYNRVTGLEDFSFNDPSVLNFKFFVGDYSEDSKLELNNSENDTFYATNTFGYNSQLHMFEGFSIIDGGTNNDSSDNDILMFSNGGNIMFKDIGDSDDSCIYTFIPTEGTKANVIRYDNFETIELNSSQYSVDITLESINTDYTINIAEGALYTIEYGDSQGGSWIHDSNTYTYTYTNTDNETFNLELKFI